MQIVSSGGFFCASMLLSDNGIDNNDALPRQDAVQISHACCKIGVRATRPRLHQHRLNVGESLVCINIGSTWATRPRLQQHRLNVGDSPSFATTSAQRGRLALVCINIGSMSASRPRLHQHRLNEGESPSFATTSAQRGRVAHTPITRRITPQSRPLR